MTTITSFAAEILSMIFYHVDQRQDLLTCTYVNTQFYSVATPMLWRRVHLEHPYSTFCFLYRSVMAQHALGALVRHLHVQDYVWRDKVLLGLMRATPFLTSLVLGNATRLTSTSSLQAMDHYWPRLASLHLDSTPVTSLTFRALGRLPHLIHLELWNCIGLQSDFFSVYFENSPLERLALALWVNDDDDDDDEQEEVTMDLTCLRQLTHLQLHGPSFGILNHAIMGDPQGNVSWCWPRLTSLDLEACFDLDDDEAASLVHRLPPGLAHLTMKDGKFTNITLEAIATCQPNLITLDVSFNNQLTPRGIRDLVCRCRSLTLLTLSYCSLSMDAFQEAGPECQGSVVTVEDTLTSLDHLDKQALDAIRRGPDHGDQDDKDRDGD